VLAIRKAGKVVVIADGQVSLGHTVVKPNARKVRRIKDSIIVGFAGATADCLTLFERLELKLEEYPGQLLRSCVEMAKNWRTDKYLRRLEVRSHSLTHALTYALTHSRTHSRTLYEYRPSW